MVWVDDVIKPPLGLRGFAGRDVTVQLLHPLAAGRYIFFADPLAVGNGIVVKQRAHLDATVPAREGAAAAVVATSILRAGRATRVVTMTTMTIAMIPDRV